MFSLGEFPYSVAFIQNNFVVNSKTWNRIHKTRQIILLSTVTSGSGKLYPIILETRLCRSSTSVITSFSDNVFGDSEFIDPLSRFFFSSDTSFLNFSTSVFNPVIISTMLHFSQKYLIFLLPERQSSASWRDTPERLCGLTNYRYHNLPHHDHGFFLYKHCT